MIKKSTHSVGLLQLTGYIILCSSIIALFFTDRWAIGSLPIWKYFGALNTMNISVRNLVLFALNIGMAIIIKAEEKNTDERGVVIQNYSAKWTFRFAVFFAVMMGLIINTNWSFLIYAAVVQAYYLILFKVCMYRDSALVYMDEAQIEIYSKKIIKNFRITFFSQLIITSGIASYFSTFQHNAGAYNLSLLIGLAICILTYTIYTHWKS